MNRDFKGVWIPKEIWLDKNLPMKEKVLLVEIDSLDNDKNKGCFASNAYLAEFIQVSEGTCANMISSLKKRKYLEHVFFDGRNRGLRLHKNVKAAFTKKPKQPPENNEHSNTVINTTNNKEEIEIFKEKEVFTIAEKQAFAEFTEWINKNYEHVSRMQQPFTIKEFLDIKQKFSDSEIEDLIMRMYNYLPLLKRNISAYKTFIRWAKRDVYE